MPNDLRETLAAMDSQFQATPPAERAGDLPEGKYQLQLGLTRGGAVVNRDKDGSVRARVMLTVVAGPDDSLAGRKSSKSWNLAREARQQDGSKALEMDERGVSYVKADLATLGAPCEKLSQVGPAFMSVMGAVVDATVRHKDDDQGVTRVNIYFNALASPGEPAKSSAY